MAKLGGYTAAAVLVVVLSVPAMAEEIQLAGIRLGQHAINLLDVWGQPDGIVVGEGPEPSEEEQKRENAAELVEELWSAAGAPGGMGMGGPGGTMMGPAGNGGPMGPAMGLRGMSGPPSGMQQSTDGRDRMPPGADQAREAGAAARTDGAVPFPIWALPVWIPLRPGEVEWIYQRGPVVMGFAIDRDGYITCIAVAGRECNWARTALWQPHRYVKLGDSLKRVLYRYGYPDRIDPYTASGPMTGDNSISVRFGVVKRTFSRDCILRYEEESNIAFTLHDLKVVRIHIWQR